MKILIKYVLITLISISLFNCNSDDDSNSEQNLLLGKWEVTSGNFIGSQPKYLIFNSNNTLDFLFERDLGFKRIFTSDYTVSSESEVEINVQGFLPFQYTLNQNTLSISDGPNTLQLIKNENAPNVEDWIKVLSILEEGNAPWDGSVDIAFTYDKTKIVYGNTNTSEYIGLIDPNTFEEVGQIETTYNAYAVEVEKFDVPDKYIFQSDGGSDRFYGYSENNNNLDVTSSSLGPWIRGLASINSTQIWASSHSAKRLYLYNYSTELIEETIAIEIQPEGLDYQNGFLYICDGQYLHKCQTTPNFEALETYIIEDKSIEGIAFDGTNFWINGRDFSSDSPKLIKTNLTL